MSGVRRQRESEHHRPLFSLLYAAFARLAEPSLAGPRADTLAAARGRLLVLGAGQGHDLAHLPPTVTAVVAVEPDPAMRRRAGARMAAAAVPVAMVGAAAERLPFADASFDSLLCALVLCSVNDPEAAAREAHRVLRADGRLLVLEHVRAPNGSLLGRAQDAADPLWSRVAGGCHPNRRTRATLEAAGFDTAGVADQPVTKVIPLIAPGLRGLAVPRR